MSPEKEIDFESLSGLPSHLGSLEKPSSPQIQAQLDAYNAGDLDLFCACYTEDVIVEILGEDEQVQSRIEGIAALRSRYEERFGASITSAVIVSRMVDGPVTTEREFALWTDRKDINNRTLLVVTVTYKVNHEGKIKVAQFRNMRMKQIEVSI